MSFVTALGTVFVLWYSGSQMLAGRMTLGELVKFLIYLTLFYEPVARLHGLNQMLQAARAAGERVFDILDAAVERDARPESVAAAALNGESGKSQILREPVCGEVVYENVGFSYSAERPILRGVSLHARPG